MGMSKTLTAAVTAVALMTGLGASNGHAEERVFFGIATGGTGGTYYPLGGMLAQILSNSTALEGKNSSLRLKPEMHRWQMPVF